MDYMKENQAAKPPKPQSNQQRKSTYKPYSLKEYQEKAIDPSAYKMGGLGANIGSEEWKERNTKLQAMKHFASKVKIENRARSLNPPPKKRREEVKEKSSREKALEFSKNVKKPKLPPKKKPQLKKFNSNREDEGYEDLMGGLDDVPEEPKYNELDDLNQKHEDYLNEVNDIKKLFM